MKTQHKIFYKDSREMKELSDESVDLMITSPPYPMIKMWDGMFSEQNQEIKKALENGDGEKAFELMHKELDKVWKETFRVLKNGGIACINIGDATRSFNGKFQIFTNHVRILNHCLNLGFHVLPEILWIKETNKPDKFMGSGMLPVGAYVTLEHEHILILRKDGKRNFTSREERERRQRSAFFWEERNIWFSDKWKDVRGVLQSLNNKNLRERSAAFPFELAYRLINMYSVQGDVVLDPFLGTGTTTIGAMASRRNSFGYEVISEFKEIIDKFCLNIKNPANRITKERINRHKKFIEKRKEQGKEIKHFNKNYGFPVMTRQETKLLIPEIKNVEKKREDFFEVEYY